MALIACRECNKGVAPMVKTCPNCGAEDPNRSRDDLEKEASQTLGCTAISLLLFLGFFLTYCTNIFGDDDSSKPSIQSCYPILTIRDQLIDPSSAIIEQLSPTRFSVNSKNRFGGYTGRQIWDCPSACTCYPRLR